jgi:hypothetical protein
MTRTKLVENTMKERANQKEKIKRRRIRRKTRAGKASKDLFQLTCFITTIDDQF